MNRSFAFPPLALTSLETKHTILLKKALPALDGIHASAAGQRQSPNPRGLRARRASGRRIPSTTGRLNP